MYSSSRVALILLNGAIGGAVWVLVAHYVRRFTRHILAAILIVAAVFYVSFTVQAGASSAWIAAEVAGVLLFGGMAVSGMRGSPWWLAAGWALHPVWDIPLHYFGPGHAFAPESYAIACLSWDWVIAGYLAYRPKRNSRASGAGRPRTRSATIPAAMALKVMPLPP
jgi:hypothetical protein